MNIQDWFPLGLTGLISLQSKGLSSLLQNQNGSGSWQWILGSVLLERRGLALTDPEGSALQLPNILKQSKKKKKKLSLCWAGRAILDSIGLYPCVVHHRYFLESISRKSTRKMQKSACHIMRSFWTPRRCRGSGRTKRTSALWVFIDSKAQLTGTWVEAVERRMPLGTHAWVSSLQ